MESSPLPLQSLARLRTSAMSTAKAAPAVDQPCTSRGEPLLRAKSMARAPPTALALFQEHVQVLRQHLVGAEQTLDTTDPDELRLLKKALIQVSKMISQMESVANTLEQRRLNLRNELRTLEDENSQLKKALFRERRKTLNKKANDSPRLGERIISPPPPFYRGESNVDYDSLRQFLFAPTILRFPSADENDSLADFLFDGPDNSASTSKVSTVFGANPGTSGKAKRGRGGSPTGRSASNVMGGKRSGSVKRGWGTTAARARPRPLLRTLAGVETGGASSSAAPVPALNDVILLGGSAPAMTPVALTPPPLPSLEQNEIDDLAQRLRNRNNKFAGKKEEAFTIIEWNASID
ncbi:uncharacterized protein [Dermacentor albipictus]|uniref:uncharacterized protein n=1 Tax=Dermacentor albipictus TaxID=60249 RepID=UPI0038FC3AB9